MKKQLLSLLALAIATTSFAQVAPTFGLRGGLSSASMRGESVDNLKNVLEFADGKIATKNRTGFFVGAYATIPVDKMISVEPGLYYSQKGYELNGGFSVKGAEFINANAKAQLQSDYIDMPLLLKADLGGGLQLFAGPQFSYLMKANLRTTAGVLGINILNNTIDATDQFNRWDMGVTGGIAYKFANGMNISAAYDHGLSKVDANRNIRSYNNAIKIGVGITF